MNDDQTKSESTHARASTDDLLSVLANPIRRQIMAILARAEKCVMEIARELQIGPSTVSHYLRLLSEKNLVQRTPVQKKRIYRLSGAVEASIQDSTVRFVVTAANGERISFEIRDR